MKDARLPERFSARNSDEAMAIANKLIRYCSEPTGADKWLRPVETLQLGAGDCEDWCIFVRALLLNGGIRPSKLWLLIVHDLAVGKAHALLWTPVRYCDARAPRPLAHPVFSDYRPMAAFNDTEALTFGRKVGP